MLSNGSRNHNFMGTGVLGNDPRERKRWNHESHERENTADSQSNPLTPNLGNSNRENKRNCPHILFVSFRVFRG